MRLTTAVLFVVCAANAQNAPGYDFTKLQEALGGAISAHQVAGISLLVMHHGQVIFQSAYGQLDIESHVPLSTDSILNLASSTKWIRDRKSTRLNSSHVEISY